MVHSIRCTCSGLIPRYAQSERNSSASSGSLYSAIFLHRCPHVPPAILHLSGFLQYTGSYNPSLLIFPCYRTSSTKICFFLFYSLTLGIAIIFFSAIKNSLTDKMRWDMIRLKSILAALNATERRSICGIRI